MAWPVQWRFRSCSQCPIHPASGGANTLRRAWQMWLSNRRSRSQNARIISLLCTARQLPALTNKEEKGKQDMAENRLREGTECQISCRMKSRNQWGGNRERCSAPGPSTPQQQPTQKTVFSSPQRRQAIKCLCLGESYPDPQMASHHQQTCWFTS